MRTKTRNIRRVQEQQDRESDSDQEVSPKEVSASGECSTGQAQEGSVDNIKEEPQWSSKCEDDEPVGNWNEERNSIGPGNYGYGAHHHPQPPDYSHHHHHPQATSGELGSHSEWEGLVKSAVMATRALIKSEPVEGLGSSSDAASNFFSHLNEAAPSFNAHSGHHSPCLYGAGVDSVHLCPLCGLGFPSEGSRNRHMRAHSVAAARSENGWVRDGMGVGHLAEEGEEDGEGESQDLQEPAASSSSSSMYPCSLCDVRLDSLQGLGCHIQLQHTARRQRFACLLCPKRFERRTLLETHLRLHTRYLAYNCDTCGKSFGLKACLRAHTQLHRSRSSNTCHVCGRRFAHHSVFLSHQLSAHRGPKPQSCEMCAQHFRFENRLLCHQFLRHGATRRYERCAMCNFRCFGKDKMARHVTAEHRKARRYECPVCQERTVNKRLFERHLQMNHPNFKAFPCPRCDRSYSNTENLRVHMKASHVDMFSASSIHWCPVCGKSFARPSRLRRHMFSHTGQRPYHCDRCQRGFYSKREVAAHGILIHGDDAEASGYHEPDRPLENHVCKVCGRVFFLRYRLTQHMKSHSGERPHRCDQCDKAFVFPRDLKVHQQTHVEGLQYSCTICGKKFKYKKTMDVHMYKHNTPNTFTCAFCQTPFISQREMITHVHEEHPGPNYTAPTKEEKKLGRRFVCLTCGLEFSNKHKHWYHNQRVRNIRNHQCERCDKEFASKKDLRVHMRCHSGVKPYNCDVCHKTFRQKGHLSVHMRSHTGEKPYHCDTCNKSFVVKSGLDKHLRLHAKMFEEEQKRREALVAQGQQMGIHPTQVLPAIQQQLYNSLQESTGIPGQ